jgi:hypothetical protein
MAKKKSPRAALAVEPLETRELPAVSPLNPASALVRQGFDYTAAHALPADWSQWDSQPPIAVSTRESLSGRHGLVAANAPGEASRVWVNSTLAANVQASAAVFADSLTPGQLLVRGQHLNTPKPTYYAVSVARGLDVQLLRVVNGVSTKLTEIHSRDYVNARWVEATLTAHGTSLRVQIYRTDTHEYLNAHGAWQRTATDALDRTDGMIRAGGLVGLAEPSAHSGSVSFDNFRAVGVTAGAHGRSVVLQQSFDTTKPGELPAGWSEWTNQGDFGVQTGLGLNSRRSLASHSATGEAARAWLNQTLPANIQASAAVLASTLIPGQVFIRGANLDTAHPTYYAVSVTRGLDVQLVRVVNGRSTVLGGVRSRNYLGSKWVVESILATGTVIRAQIYRPDTHQYLNSHGVWQSAPTWTISRSDASIRSGGRAGIGRPASHAGVVTFDDFTVAHAGISTPTSVARHVSALHSVRAHVSHAVSTRTSAVRHVGEPTSVRAHTSHPVSALAAEADTRPPSVRITTPGSGSIVSDVAIVHAAASDNVGVTHVDFFLDGRLAASDVYAPYDWVLDPSAVLPGLHHITAKAYDRAGHSSQATVNVTVHKTASRTSPSISIPQHYSWIRLADLAYGGTPIDSAAVQQLRHSVDLVVPNPGYVGDIHRIAPRTPELIYTNASTIYQSLLTDWLNYADAHGVSRESAFYHVTQATPFTGTSPSSQPVNWFWGVYQGGQDFGFTDVTVAAHNSSATVPFGGFGQAVYIGYTDPFREINFKLQSGARDGWSYVLEYATAADAQGNPINWATLRTVSDTTAGLAHSGRITFDPPSNWVTGSINGTNRLYYVRLRTVSDGMAPVARTILGRDYVHASGHNSGTIPAFDYSADRDHDGYLNDAEYAHRKHGMDARFVYETRDLSSYGQERPATNASDAAFRAWVIDYTKRVLRANPLAAGLFVDNSSGKIPVSDVNVAEALATYSHDYGTLLNQLGKAIAPHWIMANTAGGQTNADGIVAQNTAYYEEFALRPLATNYVAFEEVAAQVMHRQDLNPNGYAVLDSLPAGGSPTDARTQIATLAYYYLLADPVHTFLDFYGGYAPSTSWAQHFAKAAAVNVGKPLGTWSLFATGSDPANRALTYRVYERQYTNALVLYKPLSHAPHSSRRPSLGPASATTFNLNGSYRMVRADGTLSAPVTRVTLRNGDGAILLKA